MRNFNFKIPPLLDERLKEEAKRSGVSYSDITRRAIDEYLDRQERKHERREQRQPCPN